MDEAGFRQFLKRAGKQPHVVDGLVREVATAITYFTTVHQIGLDEVTPPLLQAYGESLPRQEAKAQLRAVGLYYKFAGNAPLASLAGQLREAGIAQTRRSFKLADFCGMDPTAVAKLAAQGIVTVTEMLAAGQTPQARQQLAEQSGLAPAVILELVKLSDLARLAGVKAVRARLYYDAGLDTPDRFIGWDAAALRQRLLDFVAQTGFDGIAPLPKELRNAIADAEKLPRVVIYKN